MLPKPTANPMEAIRKPNLEDQTVGLTDIILPGQEFQGYFVDGGLCRMFVNLRHKAARHIQNFVHFFHYRSSHALHVPGQYIVSGATPSLNSSMKPSDIDQSPIFDFHVCY